ncbi:deaminase [Actinomadura macrotermitis]|uniref:Riboflavin biosynthesis protein RibD n=1 Tax=Actinomadura macrotermitis TaxID=2585200 RepID=A0A7K0C2M7_9ACTN|nr:Riboflavin biosynthesis protein RibD [Actinomadura macrotermitis]
MPERDAAAAGPSGVQPSDVHWLALACDLAVRCPPSGTAFSVGAVIVGADGRELARGFSRERDPRDHAEESALGRLGAGADLAGATIYTSLEPCGRRLSRPRCCAELIVAAGLRRAVFAWREPALFVEGTGAELLAAHGVRTIELAELAGRAREPNAHLLG